MQVIQCGGRANALSQKRATLSSEYKISVNARRPQIQNTKTSLDFAFRKLQNQSREMWLFLFVRFIMYEHRKRWKG